MSPKTHTCSEARHLESVNHSGALGNIQRWGLVGRDRPLGYDTEGYIFLSSSSFLSLFLDHHDMSRFPCLVLPTILFMHWTGLHGLKMWVEIILSSYKLQVLGVLSQQGKSDSIHYTRCRTNGTRYSIPVTQIVFSYFHQIIWS